MDSISDLLNQLNSYSNNTITPAELKLIVEECDLSTFYSALSESTLKLDKDFIDLALVSASSLGAIEEYLPLWIDNKELDCVRAKYVFDKLKKESKSPEVLLKEITKIQEFSACQEDLLMRVVRDFSWSYGDDVFTTLYELKLLDVKLAKEIILNSAPIHYNVFLEIIAKDEGVLQEHKNQLLVTFFNFEMGINESEYDKNTEKYNEIAKLFMELATDLLDDVRKGSGLVEKLVKSGLDLKYLVKNLKVLPLFKGLYLDVIIKNHSIAYTPKMLVDSLVINDVYLGTFPDNGSLAKDIYDSITDDDTKSDLLDYYISKGISRKTKLFG